MNVLVFCEGTESKHNVSLHQMLQSLHMFLASNYAVQKITAEQLNKSPWEQTCSLLVIPDTLDKHHPNHPMDLKFTKVLQDGASLKIQKFVQNGGKFFGVGAGAAFVSKITRVPQNEEIAQIENNHYLFDGTLIAPALEQVEEDATNIHIKSTNESASIYYNRSPYFEPSQEHNEIATYSDNNKPAIIHFNQGKGSVVLSGVHPEWNPTPDALGIRTKGLVSEAVQSLLPILQHSDAKRIELLREIFTKLQLHVSENPTEPPPKLTPMYMILMHSNKKDYEAINQNMTQLNTALSKYNESPKLKMQQLQQTTPDDFKSASHQVEVPVMLTTLQEITTSQNNQSTISSHLTSTCSIDLNKYHSELKTKEFGRLFMYADVVTSTQTILSSHFMEFKDFPNGLLFSANRQVSGVGRSGNVWVSPNGCLMFSLQLVHNNFSTVMFLQYLMALSIVASIRNRPQYKDLNLRIKWPNDIYSNNRKIGGILVSSNYFDGQFHIIIGCGINLWNEKPSTCINTVISEHNAQTNSNANTQQAELPFISREELLAWIMNTFEEYYEVFSKSGFQPFENIYYRYWLHSDHSVRLQTQDEGVVDVVIKGITESGFLKTLNPKNGKMYELHPDGNSFDLMQGLIKAKV